MADTPLTQTQIDKETSDKQFEVSKIQAHAHTGTDSLRVSGENLVLRDSTINDVSTITHGFAPKLPNDSTKFFNGIGTYTVPPNSTIGVFGDGSDGDVTITTNTTLTRDMYYNNLTITSGNLFPAGFRIYVKGTLNCNSVINANGNNGSAGEDGNNVVNHIALGGAGGAAIASGSLPGGAVGQTGGNGGYVDGGAVTHAPTNGGDGDAAVKVITDQNGSGAFVVAGNKNTIGTGGLLSLGSYTGGLRGAKSGTIFNSVKDYVSAYGLFDKYPSFTAFTVSPGSGAGGGGSYDAGGGGGAGGGSGSTGGMVWISAKTIVNTNQIFAKGGNGANGGAAGFQAPNHYGGSGGGGSGGDGGVIILIYESLTNSGTISCAGGVAGTAGTSGDAATLGQDGANGNAGVVIQISML